MFQSQLTNPLLQLKELWREIHLATTSQDLVALEGIESMIEKKTELEKELGLDDPGAHERRSSLFDDAIKD